MDKPDVRPVIHAGSNDETILKYFEKVRELRKTGVKYPVDFTMMWRLAYTLEENAIRALKNEFVENTHYQVVVRNDGVRIDGSRGNSRKTYELSVECMEHFIAKKIPSVFEVYRQVFHASLDEVEKPKSFLDLAELTVKALREQNNRIDDHEQRLLALEEIKQLPEKTLPEVQEVIETNVIPEVEVIVEVVSELPERNKTPITVRKYCDDRNLLMDG